MNQKFEELKLRAVREANVEHIDFDNMSQTDIRMLGDIAVELIIQECIDVANDTRYDGKVVANRIKFVFGVEE